MSIPEEPKFLQGTFSWSEMGYRYERPPDINLLDPQLAVSANPWLKLASALAFAQQGHFEFVEQLPGVVTTTDAGGLVQSCLCLIGDAGSATLIQHLPALMAQELDTYTRVKACSAGLHAGYLWLVKPILAVWNTIHPREKGLISLYLSELLEAEAGDISAPEDFDSDADYVTCVEDRAKELSAQHGADAVIFRGRLSNIKVLVDIMHSVLDENISVDAKGTDFLILRHRFEAQTGIDCSSFYEKDRFQPHLASHIIENFRADPVIDTFKPGTRYFFGHPVIT